MASTASSLFIGVASHNRDTGPYRIRGRVIFNALPVRRRVVLYTSSPMIFIGVTYSDAATGEFVFSYISYRLKGYRLICEDTVDSSKYTACVDYITPELMP